MSDRFETDAMEDLFSDEAEGASEFEEFEDDGFEDAADDDEFLSRVVGGIGQVAGGLLGADELDDSDDFEDAGDADLEDLGDDLGDAGDLGEFDSGDEWDDAMDSVDDAVADALEADDADEFFRRLGRIARRVGRGVGQAARVIGPIASAIPIPQAQAIGRIANIAGRLLADGADEFEAIDELVDLVEDEGDDSIDAAAPIVAGLALRRLVPGVSRIARPQRRQLVRGVSQATRTLVRRHGPRAARAVPRIVRGAQRAVRQRRIPGRALPQAVRRTAARVARHPRALRRLARPVSAGTRRRVMGGIRGRRTMGGFGRRGIGGLGRRRTMGGLGRRAMGGLGRRRTMGGLGSIGGGTAGYGGPARRVTLSGPVEIIIRSRGY
jgi:hypothetical protein